MSIYIANWKNINAKHGSLEFIKKFQYNNSSANVIICPPLPYLNLFESYDRASIGVQKTDISNGNLTGAVVPRMLKDFGVRYSIVGHSDNYMSDEIIARTIRALGEFEIIPIVCFGENLKSKSQSISELRKAYTKFISLYGCREIIIAYEPAWTIGGKSPDSVSNISDVYNMFSSYFTGRYGSSINMKMVYGGSVTQYNASDILSVCDGLLVGRAGADPLKFAQIIDTQV